MKFECFRDRAIAGWDSSVVSWMVVYCLSIATNLRRSTAWSIGQVAAGDLAGPGTEKASPTPNPNRFNPPTHDEMDTHKIAEQVS